LLRHGLLGQALIFHLQLGQLLLDCLPLLSELLQALVSLGNRRFRGAQLITDGHFGLLCFRQITAQRLNARPDIRQITFGFRCIAI
jgi:hypothetical protein